MSSNIPVLQNYQKIDDPTRNIGKSQAQIDAENDQRDITKAKIEEYGKKLKLPKSTTLYADFHPLLPDHFITVNKLDFPKIGKNTKIQGMMHEIMVNGFEEAITNKYLSDARKNEVKKGKKVGEIFGFKKEEGDENSLPEEPSSYEWDNASSNEDDDDEDEDNSSDDYSGGEDHEGEEDESEESGGEDNEGERKRSEEKRSEGKRSEENTLQPPTEEVNKDNFKPKKQPSGKQKTETTKKRAGKSCFSKIGKRGNKIETVTLKYPKELPKLTGNIPKPVRQEQPNSFKEDGESSETFQYVFNKAVDMYIEDNNLMFSYTGYNSDLVSDQDQRKKEEYDATHNPLNHYSTAYVYSDEMNMFPFNKNNLYDFVQLSYSNIAEYQGFNYIPPLFYEKFEICLWKIDELNVAKIKQNYFTPNVRLF